MSTLTNITFDSADPPTLAAFWAAVLDREVAPDANEFFARIPGPGTNAGDALPNFLFVKVPEGKVAKNRVHLDVHCAT